MGNQYNNDNDRREPNVKIENPVNKPCKYYCAD